MFDWNLFLIIDDWDESDTQLLTEVFCNIVKYLCFIEGILINSILITITKKQRNMFHLLLQIYFYHACSFFEFSYEFYFFSLFLSFIFLIFLNWGIIY